LLVPVLILSLSCPMLVFLLVQLYHPANIVLEKTVERIFVGNKYAEKSLGIFVIRGENVVLLGELVRLVYPLSLP